MFRLFTTTRSPSATIEPQNWAWLRPFLAGTCQRQRRRENVGHVSERIRILWVCGSRVCGGAERATLRLLELLRDRGHVVEACCRPAGEVDRAVSGARLPAYRAPLGLRTLRTAWGMFDQVKPDIVLVTSSREWLSACLVPRRRRQPRLVVVRHMTLPLSPPLLWVVRHRADAAVAVSEAVRASLVGKLRLPTSMVHVIHNPVRFPPRAAVPTLAERVRARVSLGMEPTGRWVGFFGGLNPAKGVRDVLSAVAAVNRRLGDTQLLIAGRQGNRSLLELTGAFPAAGRSLYLGEVDRMDDALTACDVVVMATRSTLSEALPLTLMEAMSCGTPVLAYATGGIPELIGSDGQAGRLARPDDEQDLARLLIELLGDPTAAEHCASNGLLRIRHHFDPQAAAEQYEALFQTLCDRP